MPPRYYAGLRGGREGLALFALRFVVELLAADGRLVHQAALGDREDCHALLVLAGGLGVALGAACARARAAGRGLCRSARRDRHRGGLRAELEIAAGEFVERPLVLEEDDLAVRLAAELQPDGELRHRGVADVGALRVHAAGAVRAADADAALADG